MTRCECATLVSAFPFPPALSRPSHLLSLLPFQTTTSATFVRTLATEATPAPTRHHAAVEELHSQTAAEILAERDGDKSGSIQHFIVSFG